MKEMRFMNDELWVCNGGIAMTYVYSTGNVDYHL